MPMVNGRSWWWSTADAPGSVVFASSASDRRALIDYLKSYK
jgi:hypothetical protein